jgi:hypothetical protein
MDRADPRLAWLAAQAVRWRQARQKTLVFAAHRETLEMLRAALSARASLASRRVPRRPVGRTTRHRGRPVPGRRWAEPAGVHRSRRRGRNFEFCHRLVLYDLPWKPSAVEQRIGRLDRIGRRIPVEIVYFRPASGSAPTWYACTSASACFVSRSPGSSRNSRTSNARSTRSRSIHQRVDGDGDRPAPRRRAGRPDPHSRRRVPAVASRSLSCRAGAGHPRPCPSRPRCGDGTCRDAHAARVGFRVEQVRGRRAYAIEFGNEALVDSLPGVSGRRVVRRLVRSRVRRRGRDARLLRVRPSAGRRAACAHGGGARRPRGTPRAPPARRAWRWTGRDLQGRAAGRGACPGRHWPRPTSVGRRAATAAGGSVDHDGQGSDPARLAGDRRQAGADVREPHAVRRGGCDRPRFAASPNRAWRCRFVITYERDGARSSGGWRRLLPGRGLPADADMHPDSGRSLVQQHRRARLDERRGVAVPLVEQRREFPGLDGQAYPVRACQPIE